MVKTANLIQRRDRAGFTPASLLSCAQTAAGTCISFQFSTGKVYHGAAHPSTFFSQKGTAQEKCMTGGAQPPADYSHGDNRHHCLPLGGLSASSACSIRSFTPSFSQAPASRQLRPLPGYSLSDGHTGFKAQSIGRIFQHKPLELSVGYIQKRRKSSRKSRYFHVAEIMLEWKKHNGKQKFRDYVMVKRS